MKCLECRELISAYIDDQLSNKEVKRLLLHLETCKKCKKELSEYILQKDELISLRSSYSAPAPAPDFSQKVMEFIEEERSFSEISRARLLLSDFYYWIFLPVKKPVFAISLTFLLLTGIATGLLLGTFSLKTDQNGQLLTVYELQAKQISEENGNIVNINEDDESITFGHFAYSSAENLAANPCLLEYAAYTTVSDNY